MKDGEASLMTVAAFIARLEQERDSIDEAIRLMRSVARLLDGREAPPARDLPATRPGEVIRVHRVTNLTDAQIDEGRRLWIAGQSAREIAPQLGVSNQYIAKLAEKLQWPVREPPKGGTPVGLARLTRFDWPDARRRYVQGETAEAIAKVLGCSVQAVHYHSGKEKWKRDALNGNGATSHG